MITRIICLFLMATTPVAAQDAGMTYAQFIMSGPGILSESEWRDLTGGRTVLYRDGMKGGPAIGREYYPTDSNLVYFLNTRGQCFAGEWTFKNRAFCFDWGDDAPSCFYHKRSDGDIYTVVADPNNFDPEAEIQIIEDIIDAPFQCAP
ncbi:MAG: hypothetical protein JKY31_01030 [Rhodobacteraceae bacterium]|nr:hypothetical protein [Paracoccaceae bacterium]